LVRATPSERIDSSDGADPPLIAVVVPVYREEQNIGPFLARTVPVLERLGSYEILFCLDPSPDRTEALLREAIALNPRLRLLVFSRRFGQPAATMAGIFNCRGRWCVVIDVDLQDPPEVIAALWCKAQEGFEVVTARRVARDGETRIKRAVASLYYQLIARWAEVPIPRDTGDFRLISRRVIEELRALGESHGFLRGLVSLVGFAQAEVPYERDARQAGAGHYNRYTGSLKIGLNGLFGFSAFPLRLMMWAGLSIAGLSTLALFAIFALAVARGGGASLGLPTIALLVLFVGGVQLAGLGVLGEYVGRIYDEVRRRPMYVIDRAVNIEVRDRRGPRTGEGSPP
jgi:glycosyltransferase involved in cell wall biosynthesis